MPPKSGTRKELLLFVALCLTVYAYHALEGGWAYALGATPLPIVSFIAVGRVALWLGERLLFFFQNLVSDTARHHFEQSLWQDMSLSLVIGIPPVLWLYSLTPTS